MDTFLLKIVKEDLLGRAENARLIDNFFGTTHSSLLGNYLVIG
jgi:hypothetical protein